MLKDPACRALALLCFAVVVFAALVVLYREPVFVAFGALAPVERVE